MSEQATETITIAAPPERCYAVALDVERYPEWASDIKEVEVHERDGEGRPHRVTFRAGAMGQSVRYTLEYDHANAPRVLAWRQIGGDLTRRLDGSYEFLPAAGGGTEVRYHLLVDLKVPLLGFIKRRAEHKILSTALRDLKLRAERA